jgi:hypothetical protein
MLVIDELTKSMKAAADDTTPSDSVVSVLTSSKFVRNGLLMNSLHSWMMSLLTKTSFDHKQIKKLYRVCETWFRGPVNIQRFTALQKRIIGYSLPAHSRERKELRLIEDFCVEQVQLGHVTAPLMEIFTSVVGKTKQYHRFFDSMNEWIGAGVGPAAVAALEQMALQGVASDSAAGEVSRVVPPIPYFFGFFSAIVAAERKNRSMKHIETVRRLSGVHRRAIELLEHPRFRFFAPLYALCSEDVTVPVEIEEFLERNQDKMQALYEVESANEW